MPRKKQTVQKQKRHKTYREGEMSGAASDIKPKGFFSLFSNYRVFAGIGVIAIVGGLIFTALYQGGNNGRNPDTGSVRGEDVIRKTPQAGEDAETPTTGASANIKQYTAAPAMTIDPNKTYVATIKTAKGEIKIELDAKAAPQTVNNFVFLAKDGYYNGVTFHRVLPDLLAQTGDPTGTGSGGPGYDLPVEKTSEPFTAGVIAMAKPQEAGAPNNGSQFFIMLADEPTFEGDFTAFGKVTDGLDVLRDLTPRDPQVDENPEPGDRIESIEISET